MKTIARLHILLLAIILIAFSAGNAQTVIPTEIPVSYDVSSSGAFTYTVPIEVPPGVKDMFPNLAINYNSQGGNGPLGMCWSLGGLSTISRTGSTIYHNRSLSQVNFSASDVFTLDGQRLIETSPGTYMTQVKNFAIIQAHGTSGGGPSYFTVEYPNGLTYEYGNTDSSKMKASGRSDVLIWAVNKIYDKCGNYIDFTYHNDQSNGEYYITHIFYGGNSNSAIQAVDTINFNYIQRSDPNKTLIAGSFVKSKVVVRSIEIKFSNGALANTYEFAYDFGEYARLTEIKEIRGNNNQLPPIKINWGSLGTTEVNITDLPDIDSTAYVMGDFNADGSTDMVRSAGNYLYNVRFFYSNKNNTFRSESGQGIGYTPDMNWYFYQRYGKGSGLSLDMTGDGLDDVLFVEKELQSQALGNLKLHLYTAMEGGGFIDQGIIFNYENYQTGTTITNPGTAKHFIDWIRLVPGDFDGDGIKDIIVLIPSDLTAYNEGQLFDAFIVGAPYSSGVNPNLGNYGTLMSGWWTEIGKIQHEIYAALPMDYDGDGKTELLTTGNGIAGHDAEIWQLSPTYNGTDGTVTYSGNLSVIYYDSYPSHRTRIELPANTFIGKSHWEQYEYKIWPADFNGDGKDDLLTWYTMGGYGTAGTWQIAYSTGNLASGSAWEFASNSALPLQTNELYNNGPWFPGRWEYQVADFNGDGKADILQLNDVNVAPPHTNYNIYYSLGSNIFIKEAGYLPDSFQADDHYHCLGDFNGDGQIDILDYRWGRGTKIAYFRKNDASNVVTSIEHAGRKLEVEIKSIASATPDTLDEDHYGHNFWQIDDSSTIHTPREYPYITRQLPIKVVTSLHDNISMAKSYYYQTLSYHLAGLGMQGFEKIKIRDFASQKIITNHFSLFPWWGYKEGYSCTPFLYETTVALLNNPSDIISNTRRSYFDKPADANGKVRIIKNYGTNETNYLTGKYTDYHESYDFNSWHFKDFGLPEWAFTDISVQNGYARDSIIFSYDVNASFINKAKPVSIRKSKIYPSVAPYSRTTDYGYNSKGLLWKQTTDPGTINETITDYTYDATFGNLVSTNLHAGVALPAIQKDYAYSSNGKFKIADIKYLAGSAFVDSFWHNGWGKITKHQESNSLKTHYRYDSVNRLISTIYPDDAEELINYDWAYNQPYGDNPNPVFSNYQVITQNHLAAQFVVTTTKTGSWPKYKFVDFYGKTLRHSYPSFWGNQTIYEDFVYGADGRIIQTTDPYYKGGSITNTLTYGYDPYGREIKHTPSFGAIISTKYEASVLPGFLKTMVTNETTGQHKTTYSNLGGIYFIDDNSTPVEYTLLSNGQPEYITVNNDPNLATYFHYDDYGRMDSKTEPNKGTIAYKYNAYDQLTNEEYDNKVSYEYKYDEFGRVISKTDKKGRWFKYEYYNTPNSPDEGKIKLETTNYDTTGKIVSYYYEYNSVGKLYKKTETIDVAHSYTTIYTYHFSGRISTIQYPSNDVVFYHYANSGHLWLVDLNGKWIWGINDKNELGQVTDADYYNPSGVQQPLYHISRTYDELGFPKERRVVNVNSNLPVSDQGYKFDQSTGNLSFRDEKIHTLQEDFVYDSLDRLTDVHNGWVQWQHIDYDRVGNILKKNDVTSSSYDWQYNAFALKTVPDDIGGTKELSSARQPFTQLASYYPFNKVKRVSEGTNEIYYTYGPDEERVKAEYDPALPSPKTRYYATNYEETYENSGYTKVDYIWALGEPIAMLFNHNGNKQLYYLITDHAGSITQILDNIGTVNNGVVEERNYDAWGRPRDPLTGFFFNPSQAPGWMIDRGYTGHEHIWLTNNYDHNIINMNGRLYDPLVGRMFSPDPVVPDNTNSQAYNKYSYVLNNPLKYTDPNGENPLLVALGAFVIGGAINTAIHWDDIMRDGGFSWSKATAAFVIGGTASTAAVLTGGLGAAAAPAASSIAGAVMNAGLTGMASYGVSSEILITGNMAVFGDAPPSNTEFIMGAGLSFLLPAIGDGLDAYQRGAPLFASKSVGSGLPKQRIVLDPEPDDGTIIPARSNKGDVVVTGKTSGEFTKSDLKTGRDLHSKYRADFVDEENGLYKEYRLPSGKKIDFLDTRNHIIYEYKPYNPRQMQQGLKQLETYMKELEAMPDFRGVQWKRVLDLY